MARQKLVKIIDAERGDTKERVMCLRLQAFAWRQIAMIAMYDQKYARSKVAWLMAMSVPFVNGPALEEFIANHEDMAKDCGIKAGVLSASR